MTTQLNKLKALHDNLRDYHAELLNQERRATNELQLAEHYGKTDAETLDMRKEIADLRETETQVFAQMVEVGNQITASKQSQFSRLKTTGKRQADLLKAAIKANPDKETEDLAKLTGLSEARVRQLARILAETHQITRTGHQRWNGMHYLTYFTYREVQQEQSK